MVCFVLVCARVYQICLVVLSPSFLMPIAVPPFFTGIMDKSFRLLKIDAMKDCSTISGLCDFARRESLVSK